MQITDFQIMIRIACAVFCGGVIGFERERREKAAGLRTHIFVCMGAALAMIVSAFGFGDALTRGASVLDPSRVAAQVVSGVGFIGAGVIWFTRNKVRGLDTAAGIWTTSAVGLAAGGGLYTPAFVVTLTILLMNLLLKGFEEKYFRRRKESTLTLTVTEESTLDEVHKMVKDAGLAVRAAKLGYRGNIGTLALDVSCPKDMDWLIFIQKMQKIPDVTTVSYNEPIYEGD